MTMYQFAVVGILVGIVTAALTHKTMGGTLFSIGLWGCLALGLGWLWNL